MQKIIISICIPTYNRSKNLKKQLIFLLNEFRNYRDKIEILVSDNASLDNVQELLEEIYLQDDFFSFWINSENLGMVGNICKVAEKAIGKYVWIVGDDDILLEGVADRIFQVICEYPEIGLVSLDHSAIRGDRKNIVVQNSFSLKGGYYPNGKETMKQIIDFNEYGSLMFITANIVRKDIIVEVITNTDKTSPTYH